MSRIQTNRWLLVVAAGWLALSAVAAPAAAQQTCNSSITVTFPDPTRPNLNRLVGENTLVRLELANGSQASDLDQVFSEINFFPSCSSTNPCVPDLGADGVGLPAVIYSGNLITDCEVEPTINDQGTQVDFDFVGGLTLLRGESCFVEFTTQFLELGAPDGFPTFVQNEARETGACIGSNLTSSNAGSGAVTLFDCSVEVAKQVRCNPGDPFSTDCVGWDGEPLDVRYDVTGGGNSLSSDLVNCRVTDSNGQILSGVGGTRLFSGPISPGDTIFQIDADQLCSDSLDDEEPDVADIVCDCAARPDLPDFAQQVSNQANFECQESGVELVKVCDAQNASAVNEITLTVTNPNANGRSANLINCVVEDALAGYTSPSFDLAAGASVDLTTSVSGLADDTLNTATVICEVEGAGGKTVTDEAEDLCTVERICDVQLDRQVSCDGGVTWTDAGPGGSASFDDNILDQCTTLETADVKVRWVAVNNSMIGGQVAEVACDLTDDNPFFGVTDMMVAVPAGTPGVIAETSLNQCVVVEDGEPGGVQARLSCECLAADDETVFDTDQDDDTAGFECEAPDVDAVKECTSNNGDGTYSYAVKVTNNGEMDLENCRLADPLAACGPLTQTALAPGQMATAECVGQSNMNMLEVTCDVTGTHQPLGLCPDDGLADHTVTSAESHSTCGTFTAGSNLMVMGPGGDLTLTAGQAVVFDNGFSVGVNGSLTAGTDPSMLSGPQTVSDEAAAGCVDLDKQISCDGGATFSDVGYNDNIADSCTGWSTMDPNDPNDPGREIVFRYLARTGAAMTQCVLGETNPLAIPPSPPSLLIGDLPKEFEGIIYQTPALFCDEVKPFEPDTATLTCLPLPDEPGDPTPQPVSDSDSADLECLAPGLTVVKECSTEVDPATGDFIYTVTVTNSGDAPLDTCEVVDTTAADCDMTIPSLAPGQSEPITCLSDQPTNAVTVTCHITGTADKTITASDEAECDVSICLPKLTFEELAAGDIVTEQYAGLGIHITTDDPSAHPAMIFDSFNPTGGDTDLGTPNVAFGGPGVGAGGGFGQPGQNSIPLGKVLIISEDAVSANPDDNSGGGTIIFTFDQGVELHSVGILDIDGQESMGMVTAYNGAGAVLASGNMQPLGDNSHQNVPVEATAVRRIEVWFPSSGSVTDIFFCPEYCVEEAINDPRVQPVEAGHAFYLPGISSEFVFTPAGYYAEFDDGAAVLTGTIRDIADETRAFDVNVMLTGRTDAPPAGSPKKEMLDSAYVDDGGPIDPSTWHYYTDFTGALTGIEAFAGAEIIIIQSTGPAFQVGKGANNKNTNYGAASWFLWTVVSQPTSGETLQVDGQGDINIEIRCECVECVPMTSLDEFDAKSYDNSDGPHPWLGPWMEEDGGNVGAVASDPTSGWVQVLDQGGTSMSWLDSQALRLYGQTHADNQGFPDPSAKRSVDLTGKLSARLMFDWEAGWSVDDADEVVVEISSNGVTFDVLDSFSWITGKAHGSESYDITAWISGDTTIRFRVSAYYGGDEEFFWADNIKVTSKCFREVCDETPVFTISNGRVDYNDPHSGSHHTEVSFDFSVDGAVGGEVQLFWRNGADTYIKKRIPVSLVCEDEAFAGSLFWQSDSQSHHPGHGAEYFARLVIGGNVIESILLN